MKVMVLVLLVSSLLLVPSLAMGQQRVVELFDTETTGPDEADEAATSEAHEVALWPVRVWLREPRTRPEVHWLDRMLGYSLEEVENCSGARVEDDPRVRERRQ